MEIGKKYCYETRMKDMTSSATPIPFLSTLPGRHRHRHRHRHTHTRTRTRARARTHAYMYRECLVTLHVDSKLSKFEVDFACRCDVNVMMYSRHIQQHNLISSWSETSKVRLTSPHRWLDRQNDTEPTSDVTYYQISPQRQGE